MASTQELSKDADVKSTLTVNDTGTKVEAPTDAVSDVEAEVSQTPAVGRPALPLTVTDALDYLDAVRTRYEAEPEVYQQFLEVMTRFKTQEIDTLDVMEQITHLFVESPDLIMSFNAFIPSRLRLEVIPPTEGVANQALVEIITREAEGTFHRIPVDLTEEDAARLAAALRQQGNNAPPPPVPTTTQPSGIDPEFAERLQYLDVVKTKYDDGTEDNAYKELLRLLAKHEELGLPALTEQVQGLFKDEPELYQGFLDYVPSLSAA